MQKKIDHLKQILEKLGSVLVAFSGGVDSAFLLKIAKDVLGKKAVAVTIDSQIYPAFELEDAKKVVSGLNAEHIILVIDALSNPKFVKNPVNRCYICKKYLFSQLEKLAKEMHISYVVEGSNLNDLDDFRPGTKALLELGIKSPLLEAKLTKEEIRKLSRNKKLFTWNKPSCTCLATRIPYGEEITFEKLNRIEKAEDFLRSLGVGQVRVRDCCARRLRRSKATSSAEGRSFSEGVAKIEVLKEDMPLVLKNRTKIIEKLSKLGYHYITLDLEGYRMGRMNTKIRSTKHEIRNKLEI
jgi:uncharacterized protein